MTLRRHRVLCCHSLSAISKRSRRNLIFTLSRRETASTSNRASSFDSRRACSSIFRASLARSLQSSSGSTVFLVRHISASYQPSGAGARGVPPATPQWGRPPLRTRRAIRLSDGLRFLQRLKKARKQNLARQHGKTILSQQMMSCVRLSSRLIVEINNPCSWSSDAAHHITHTPLPQRHFFVAFLTPHLLAFD